MGKGKKYSRAGGAGVGCVFRRHPGLKPFPEPCWSYGSTWKYPGLGARSPAPACPGAENQAELNPGQAHLSEALLAGRSAYSLSQKGTPGEGHPELGKLQEASLTGCCCCWREILAAAGRRALLTLRGGSRNISCSRASLEAGSNTIIKR